MLILYAILLTAGISACFDLAAARIPNGFLIASLAAGTFLRFWYAAAGGPASGSAPLCVGGSATALPCAGVPASAPVLPCAGVPTLLEGAAGLVVPILLLGFFWHHRMIGAGDVKLLAVIGFYTGAADILWITFWSFAVAAVFSAGILYANGNGPERFRHFFRYVRSLARGDQPGPYRPVRVQKETVRVRQKKRGGRSRETIQPLRPDCEMHFAVAVFMEVMMYAGGVRP